MTQAPERRIVVVGGGTAGWMTAAALARFCMPGSQVTLVESDEIGTIGVGEATIPAIRNFNNALGLNEAEFMSACGATYKLGIAFEGWGKPDDGYVHAFGLVGRGLGLLPFHHYWLRGRTLGLAKPLGHYALNSLALGHNRFAHVERRPDSPLPPLPYAFHFDAGLYARFLRAFAEQRNVVRKEGKIVAVERHPETGDIAGVLLANGTAVRGDLFVDCSGFRGLLIEQELEAGYEDWTEWLRCDTAVAAPCTNVSPLLPYTRATARPAGWQWRIQLQHRIGNGHVFDSRHMSVDEATALLLANLDGEPLAEPRPIRFRTGRRRRCWIRNVVAIGLSSGFIEPLESTSIHLIQTGINRLLDLLPAGHATDAERDEYNRRSAFEMERIRDFVILHYHANQRIGEPFWDGVRSMDVPGTLSSKLGLFRSSARVFREGDELFDVPGWVQVMIGQNMVPDSWHPIADQVSPDRLSQFLDAIENAFLHDAMRMPDHAAYLSRFAPMPKESIEA